MKRVKQFRRRYGIPVVIAIVGIVIAMLILVPHYNAQAKEVAATNTALKSFIESADKQLVELHKEKAKLAEAEKVLAQKHAKHGNPVSPLVLVNKKNPMRPMSYVLRDAVTSNGATLSAKAIKSYNQMFAAAAAAGQPFRVTSSYRSYGSQVTTYDHWVSQSGVAVADTYSARPGYSEHQTGFVIDVAADGCVLDCFGTTSQYQWFKKHAAQYGFIQRYKAGSEAITGYTSEEWHYRYVGTAVAKDMQARGISTLEEYWGFSGGDYK